FIERPKKGRSFPVVFFVHGGGWITGCKTHFCHQSFELAKNGIAGVRLEYRWKSQGGNVEKVVGDVMDAIDFIRQHKDELKLDFTRVGLAGGSAGGCLSALVAQLTPECICYDGFNGLYDLMDRGMCHFGSGDFTGSTDEEKKQYSAIYVLRNNPPDTFLYHGTEDIIIDIDQSYRFADAIKQKGAKVEVLAYGGVGQSFFGRGKYLAKTTKALLDHTSFVFGLTKKKPVISDYILPPKLAKLPSGFSILGKWRDTEKSATIIEFKDDGVLTYLNRSKLKWVVSYRNHYLVWKSGHHVKISIAADGTIVIGKQRYERN
ncbi:MAG: alpha/beta hydrolase, partial [Lentisphaeraceae bacterium]|nr:alpha/beta hydrolase [Lentisphaeraceae bacterium]